MDQKIETMSAKIQTTDQKIETMAQKIDQLLNKINNLHISGESTDATGEPKTDEKGEATAHETLYMPMAQFEAVYKIPAMRLDNTQGFECVRVRGYSKDDEPLKPLIIYCKVEGDSKQAHSCTMDTGNNQIICDQPIISQPKTSERTDEI